MRFLHDDEGYQVALDQVSRSKGIPRAQVEKDYFITHVLWALQTAGLEIWFKGGTCLAKGFDIISRFSEDLDLKLGSHSFPSSAERSAHGSGWRSGPHGSLHTSSSPTVSGRWSWRTSSDSRTPAALTSTAGSGRRSTREPSAVR